MAVLFNRCWYRPWLRLRLRAVGRNFRLGYASELLNPHHFSIGDDFFSGPYGYFVTNDNCLVRIGSQVMFGSHCKIIGGNHDYSYSAGHLIELVQPMSKIVDIVIDDGVWIGAGCTILAGARIGEGAIVGAMGLVNHDIPPYTIAVGIPAKRLRPRFRNDKDLATLLANVRSRYGVEDVRSLQRASGVLLK